MTNKETAGIIKEFTDGSLFYKKNYSDFYILTSDGVRLEIRFTMFEDRVFKHLKIFGGADINDEKKEFILSYLLKEFPLEKFKFI